ncbi:MAG: heme peroxidase family protein [Niabella sp.]
MSYHGAYFANVIPFSSKYMDQGKFGRIFGNLPPCCPKTTKVENALKDMGKKGGIMDAGDDPAKTAAELITDLSAQQHNPNSPVMPAGMTFLGQFIDHDLTFDPTSSFERQVDPEYVANFRTPTLSLDNVYGSGPGASPHLYDQQDGLGGIKFLIEGSGIKNKEGIAKFDLPRNSQNTALIGDPRNDENLIVSQLHLAFLLFHNKITDHLHAKFPSKSPSSLFQEAQELVRWHYQWIVLHEFLPLLCGADTVNDCLNKGRRFYHWNNEPFIPVEFSVAAYRFGHSQIRPSYRANFGNSSEATPQPFFARIFDHTLGNTADPDDLRGGKRANRRFIDWGTFFNFQDGSMRPNKLIDTKLSSPLFDLLGFAPGDIVSLAQRNLLRGVTFNLPAGQRVAHAMKLPVLAPDVFDNLKHYKTDFENNTPLWYYILREAEVQQMGVRLGAVGSTIVTEVFIGLLEGDKQSYLVQNPFWKPTLPCFEGYRNGKDFTIADLIKIAEGTTLL